MINTLRGICGHKNQILAYDAKGFLRMDKLDAATAYIHAQELQACLEKVAYGEG